MMRALLIFLFLVGVIVAALVWSPAVSTSTNQPAAMLSTDLPLTKHHHQSNEIIDPYEISRNPYKFKGHSGILNFTYVTLLSSTGERLLAPYPGGCLRFDKMIDEHTAVYSVLVARQDVYPDGEIALILDDSDPPNFTRPWRVTVIGSIEGTNAFGGRLTVAAVKFDGYASPVPERVAEAPMHSQEPIRRPEAQDAQPQAAEPLPNVVDQSSGPQVKVENAEEHPNDEPN